MRVDHVSIAVRNMDSALAFFERILPIEICTPKVIGYDPEFNWCDFHVGKFKIELIESARPDSFVQKFIGRRGEGLHHLSIETQDLEGVAGPMERDGIRIVDRQITPGGNKTAFISPRDAHGVLIQLWEAEAWEVPERSPVVPFTLRDGRCVRMYVDHVSIAVRKIDPALEFFQKYFPIETELTHTGGYDGSFNFTTFQLNGYRIELIEEGPNPGFVTRFLDKRGEGFHHLSIDVDELDPLVEQYEADGLRVVDKFDLGGGWKTAFLSPRDAHGVLIQFWQDPRMRQNGDTAA